MPRMTARVVLICLLCTTLLPAFTSAPVSAAAAQNWSFAPGDEAAYVANINAIRDANGLGRLQIEPSMTAAARDWTVWMVENDTLAHSADITTGAPSGWTKAGENVGRGGSVNAVWEAFLDSPTHAANVLDPAYDSIGVGVAWNDAGRLYTTHRFAATSSGSAAPAPQPEPTPEAQPAPEPTPTASPAPAAPPAPDIPAELPFAGVDPIGPPAEPARLSMTMTLLLSATG